MSIFQIYNSDCLEKLKDIPDGSIDLILADPPYGTTRCKWDVVIPFAPLWQELNRVIKTNGAILIFSAQPFTTDLINSNRKNFRYEIIWEKTQRTGFLNANRMPLKAHENIIVFYKHLPVYNPQKVMSDKSKIGKHYRSGNRSSLYGKCNDRYYVDDGLRYPSDVVLVPKENNRSRTCEKKHQSEKPVSLLEYLIKTYSQENDTVLDFSMGSGSTGIACLNTNRNFIGIEKDTDIFNSATKRLSSHLL